MKILNLYCGIGGNRRLWSNQHDITSVEFNPEIAAIYKDLYPEDELIIGDANKYLEENYQKFDFIWASPPCQSHSRYRHNIGVIAKGFDPILPDMSLYSQIVFLKTYFKGKWLIENVVPYYKYLIKPTHKIQRHPFWCNFDLDTNIAIPKDNIGSANKISEMEEIHDIKISHYKLKNKRQVLRNCVNKELGKHILDCATRWYYHY